MTLALAENERIDWFRITADLASHGVNTEKLSRSVDIPGSTIRGWRAENGRPRFEEALKVITFWAETTGKSVDDVPRYNPYSAKI